MSPPSQPPRHPRGCGPESTLHTSLAAAGSSLGPTGRLNGADKMHGRLHMHEGLNPRARPAAGARQSALSGGKTLGGKGAGVGSFHL